MKACEQNFPVLLFITLCKVVLISELAQKILRCDHSNERTEQFLFEWSHFWTQSLCCASDALASVEREDHTKARHADSHFLLEYKYINALSGQAQIMNSLY